MKKCIAIILSVILAFTLLVVPTSPKVNAIGGVQSKLDSFMNSYPAGNRWTSSFDGGTQCYGFAKLVIYNIFGKYGSNYRSWTYAGVSTSGMNNIGSITSFSSDNVRNLLSNARCGDVLQFNSEKQHSMIVYSVDSDGVMIYHCNWDNNCGIRFEKFSFGKWSGRNSTKLTLLRADNYDSVNGAVTPSVSHTVDNSYGKNFSATANGKHNITDKNHVTLHGWVDPGDVCTIHEVYTDGCCFFTYPISTGGTNDGYGQISWFTVSEKDNRYPTPVKAYTITDTDMPAYDSVNGSSVGSIYRLDYFTVLEFYKNGWCKILCPWKGYSDGRIVYAPTSTVFDTSYTPSTKTVSVQTDTYWNPNGQSAGYIGAGDSVLIVGESNNYYQILYPISDGYKCAWAKLEHTHSWDAGTVNKAATCTATGTVLYKCTTCGATKTETIEKNANNHSGSANIVKKEKSATCSEQGYTGDIYWSCCGVLRTNGYNTDALGHDYSGKNTSSTYMKSAATCTSAAVYYYKCSRCSEKGTTTYTSGNPLGHEFTEKNTSSTYMKSAATCTSAAVYYFKCSRCSEKGSTTYTSGNPLGHNESGWIIDKEATSTDDGSKHTECTVCHITIKTESIPVTQAAHEKGDINGDNAVNNKDLTRLMKYLAGEEVEIVEETLDVNGDGNVNNKDLTRLMKYLAGEDIDIF